MRHADRDLVRSQADEIRFLRKQVQDLQEKLLYMIGKPYEVPPIEMPRDDESPLTLVQSWDPLLEPID